jgi:hypothetical protein
MASENWSPNCSSRSMSWSIAASAFDDGPGEVTGGIVGGGLVDGGCVGGGMVGGGGKVGNGGKVGGGIVGGGLVDGGCVGGGMVGGGGKLGNVGNGGKVGNVGKPGKFGGEVCAPAVEKVSPIVAVPIAKSTARRRLPTCMPTSRFRSKGPGRTLAAAVRRLDE